MSGGQEEGPGRGSLARSGRTDNAGCVRLRHDSYLSEEGLWGSASGGFMVAVAQNHRPKRPYGKSTPTT